MDEEPKGADFFSRVDYRRFISWDARWKREAPFLLEVLSNAPRGRVLDLGCGSGEHARLLSRAGFDVLGVDRSSDMLEKARAEEPPSGLEFAQADLTNLESTLSGTFSVAVCLGNTAASLPDSGLKSLFRALQKHLCEAGAVIIQVLNYERIFKRGIRHLPLNFVEEAGGELVFVRLMKPAEGQMVFFTPVTLRWSPESDEPVRVLHAETACLTAWTRESLLPVLERAGFKVEKVCGDFAGSPFDPKESNDLIVVARR